MCAVPNMADCSRSLISCFTSILFRYFMKDFELIPVVTINTCITFVTFHIRCIYTVKCLFFRIFSASFSITFLSSQFATSVSLHIPFFVIRGCGNRFLVRDVSVSVYFLIA
jgi:hypothetical protein